MIIIKLIQKYYIKNIENIENKGKTLNKHQLKLKKMNIYIEIIFKKKIIIK